MWAVNIGTLVLLAVILYTPASAFVKLAPLSPGCVLAYLGIAAASVLWYEIVKLVNHLKKKQ
jgi:Ca2+-transporting ATPase